MLSLTYTLSDIGSAAAALLKAADGRRVWLLEGQMGAGKTTLTKAVCAQLGADSALSSPTYSLINEYHTAANGNIYHLDLYRLRSLEEALDIGIEDYLLGGSYCLIEWPDLIMPLLRPGEYMKVVIESISDTERRLTAY
jgi:tRNA threonylcarbamoyladenosine biosynthesis protein TsaE